MPRHLSKVTAKGQVTLPSDLREQLGIEPGDIVEVRASQAQDERVIEVRRRPSLIEATAGIARPKGPVKHRRWDEVEDIVKEEVARRQYEEMNQ